MTKNKTLWKRAGSVAIAAVLGCTIPTLASAISTVAYADEYDTNTLYQEGVELSTQLEEEGSVLFQNNNNALPLASDVTVDLYGYMSYNIIHGGGGSGKGRWDSNCLQMKADSTSTTIFGTGTALSSRRRAGSRTEAACSSTATRTTCPR